jgi:leucyl-tRNA synthetase
VLAPEHPLTLRHRARRQEAAVRAYVDAASKKSAQDRMRDEREKTGVFTGAYAINPVNGAQVPIWIADYVLADYGYGAIMAVPAHDTRDFEFATKFNIPIIEVISGGDVTKEAYTGDGVLVNSPLIDGLRVPDAKKKITAWLEEQGIGHGTVNYKLRDWLFSRQRYWGEPFPLMRREDGSFAVVPMKDLPVLLPALDEYKPTADGQPPLARAEEWVNTTDPATGQPVKRETNTMPQWAGSCWYFLRFCDPKNNQAAWSKEAEAYWMPVDLYVGGAEHAVLHLLYSRFWHKVLYDAGHVSTKEPFQKLFNQGMILAYSYRGAGGKYHYPITCEKANELFYNDGKLATRAIAYLREPLEQTSELGIRVKSVQRNAPADSIALRQDRASSTELSFQNRQFRIALLDPSIAEGRYADEVFIETEHQVLGLKSDPGGEQRGTISAQLRREIWVTFRDTDNNFYSWPLVEQREDGWYLNGTDIALAPCERVESQIEKMSKSRYNVVNPDDVIREYGADAMRLYEMFMGPLDREKPWSDEGVQGVYRFLKRAWALCIAEDGGLHPRIVATGGDAAIVKELHKTIKAVTHDIEHLLFNTSIARMMEFVNAGMKASAIDRAVIEQFILVLAPFAPHLAEEVWARLGHTDTLSYAPWPEADESLLVEDSIEIPIQIAGKLRGKVSVPTGADAATVIAAAKADEKVAEWLEGKTIVKEIYVPGKMLNLVVK